MPIFKNLFLFISTKIPQSNSDINRQITLNNNKLKLLNKFLAEQKIGHCLWKYMA